MDYESGTSSVEDLVQEILMSSDPASTKVARLVREAGMDDEEASAIVTSHQMGQKAEPLPQYYETLNPDYETLTPEEYDDLEL